MLDADQISTLNIHDSEIPHAGTVNHKIYLKWLGIPCVEIYPIHTHLSYDG